MATATPRLRAGHNGCHPQSRVKSRKTKLRIAGNTTLRAVNVKSWQAISVILKHELIHIAEKMLFAPNLLMGNAIVSAFQESKTFSAIGVSLAVHIFAVAVIYRRVAVIFDVIVAAMLIGVKVRTLRNSFFYRLIQLF